MLKRQRKTGYYCTMKRTVAQFVVVLFVVVGMAAAPTSAQADQNAPELDGLFEQLKSSTDYHDAAAIEQAIWKIWTVRGVADVDKAMAFGIAAMNAGALRVSVQSFGRVIQLAPDFAEAWNKRATVYFMMGRFDESVSDIQRTLTLEPRHFGALSGMGLIYNTLGKLPAAAKVWERALSIHPLMPGIRARVDEIKREAKGKPI